MAKSTPCSRQRRWVVDPVPDSEKQKPYPVERQMPVFNPYMGGPPHEHQSRGRIYTRSRSTTTCLCSEDKSTPPKKHPDWVSLLLFLLFSPQSANAIGVLGRSSVPFRFHCAHLRWGHLLSEQNLPAGSDDIRASWAKFISQRAEMN